MILYGAPAREKIKSSLIDRIKELKKKPVLAIVQVGERPDSNLYIKNKIKFGEEIGIKVELKKFEYSTSENEVIEEVKKLNEDEGINGIIVQLPLPENMDARKILESIKKEKDADGLAPLPLARGGVGGGVLVTPATAKAVMAILDFYQIEITGKKACVLGQSLLAGKPISEEFEKRGAEVFRCDINTNNIPEIAKGCDILVSAVGKAGLVTKDFVNEKQVVVDVGINKTSKIVGDVAFAEVEPLVAAITPVPGGVGPLTVACLFENLLELWASNE